MTGQFPFKKTYFTVESVPKLHKLQIRSRVFRERALDRVLGLRCPDSVFFMLLLIFVNDNRNKQKLKNIAESSRAAFSSKAPTPLRRAQSKAPRDEARVRLLTQR